MSRFKTACLGVFTGTFGLLGFLSSPAVAEDIVSNQGIHFDEDTIVEFEFIESHGAYQSAFGVIDLATCQVDPSGIVMFDTCAKTPLLKEVKASDTYDTVYRRSTYETDAKQNDFLGTPGNTVPEPTAEFLFEANKKYAFYLESQFNGKYTGTVYSTDFFNSQGNRQAIYNEEGLTTEQIAKRRSTGTFDGNYFDAIVDGGVLLNFDDTGSKLVKTDYQDTDFDDFIVGVGGGYTCNYPKPGSINGAKLQSSSQSSPSQKKSEGSIPLQK